MRTNFITVILALALCASVFAQVGSVQKTVPQHTSSPISLELKNVSLGNALRAIANQAESELLFSETFVPVGRIVSVNLQNASVEEALDQVLDQTATDYEFNNSGQIILFPTKHSESNPTVAHAPPPVQIRGIVVDRETGEPLPGANVFITGTSVGAAADINGKFSFSFEADGSFTLVVRFMGYKTKELQFSPGDDLSNLRIAMDVDVFLGEAVVVTGIASKTSKAIAEVAVSRIDASQLQETQSYNDISQLLTSKVAGVRIENSSGNPGSSLRFNMRSGGGLNGDEQPVIYVDGIRIDNSEIGGDSWGNDTGDLGYGTFSDLNPEDIEKIEVLKGPAAAASYGTSGSNGVILITTKRGRLAKGEGRKLSINYKFVSGFNTMSRKYDDIFPYTYEATNAIHSNGDIRQHTLNFTGGTEKFTYYVGFDKRYEEGLMPNSWLDRQVIRANFDAYPSDKFILSASMSYSVLENRRPEEGNNSRGWLYNTSRVPLYGWCDSLAISLIDSRIRSNRFFGSFQAQWLPVKNLEARIGLGLDEGDLLDSRYLPPGYVYSSLEDGMKNVRNRRNNQVTYNADVAYSYSPFSGLNIRSMVGTQLFEVREDRFRVEKEGFLTPLIDDIEAGDRYTAGAENHFHDRQLGVFTEHSFSWIDQYFFSFMVRKDYASSIGTEAPSIVYPRASMAVRTDKYDFMPSFFDLMKLRVAYGETGVLPGRLDGVPYLWSADGFPDGVGGELSAIGNPEIQPERVKELEFGFEAEVFRNYSIEFTYYRQDAENSIVAFESAPSSGQVASTIPINIGKVKGWGIESLIQARPIRTRNFRLDLSLTNSYQDNEVVSMGGAQPIFGDRDVNVIAVGLPKHAFYVEKVRGALFRDDGTYWKPDKDEEKSYLGTPIPPYTGSFSLSMQLFKNFNVSVLAEWVTGLSICNYTMRQQLRESNAVDVREIEDLLGEEDWFPELDPAPVGSAEYIEAAHQYAFFDRGSKFNFIEDADYFKIRELSVSYNMQDLMKKIHNIPLVNDLIIGLSVRNLWTTTEYKGIDPELNFSGGRSLNRGIDFYTPMMPRVYNFWARIGL